MEQVKSLNLYHKECREIDTTANYQLDEIKESREDLIKTLKSTQETRCLTMLRSGYCLRMTTQNVKDYSNLPFFIPDGFSVTDDIQKIYGDVREYRNDILCFVHSIYHHFSELPSLLAQNPPDLNLDSVPYLPNNVRSRDFLACSTLPALFGHCWCYELRRAYIEFMIKIAAEIPQSVFKNSREHWLFECFTNYIHSSDIHIFLKLSIGDSMLQLIRENTTKSSRLISYASDMINKMFKNISTFPQDIRLLIKRFAELAPDESERLRRIEMLFIDCLLVPAISNPKAYSILPPSFSLEMSAAPSRSLQMLAKYVQLILHTKQATARNIDEEDIESMQKIPFQDFLLQLIDINEADLDIEGPSLILTMKLLNSESTDFLFSVSDICLLAQVLDSDKLDCRSRIPVNKAFDSKIQFFRIPISNVEVFGIENPKLFVNEVEKQPPSQLTSVSAALFKFFTHVKEGENMPDDLNEFLHHFEVESRLKVDLKTYTYLNHLMTRLAALNESQHSDILDSLENEINLHRKYLSRNNAILTNISRSIQKLNQETVKYNERAHDADPMIYSCLLTLFLESNPNVKEEFDENREHMLTDKMIFHEYFQKIVGQIKSFVGPIASYALSGVAEHFHTWMMQQMTLDDFRSVHPEYEDGDNRLTAVKEEVRQNICVTPAPTKLQSIFSHPPLFNFVCIELNTSESVQIPLEAMRFISNAINLIQKIFDLTVGGMPQADEMTPLFNYALLSSNFNSILSFEKYLEHFLYELPQCDLKLIDEPTSVAFTHFINHVCSLDQIIDHQM